MEDIETILSLGGGVDPKGLSPLTLAYIGDGIFELIVRTLVLAKGNAPVNHLHKRAREIVNAKAQAAMYFNIAEILTDEEAAVIRRGRNAKSYTMPKNADLMDYKYATALEALFGYLYLQNNLQRAVFLFKQGLDNSK